MGVCLKKQAIDQTQEQDRLSAIVEKLSNNEKLPDTNAAQGPGVPLGIFATALSPAEAVVKYLKEQHKLRYSEIARLLNRDQRGIWCTYRRAMQKHPLPLAALQQGNDISASLFSERRFSILEHVVHHLRGKGIAVKAIAKMVSKSPSTIATVHFRARRKMK